MAKNTPITVQRPDPQKVALSPQQAQRLLGVVKAKEDGAFDRAAKLFSMAYLTFTVANAYAEQANDQLEPYDLIDKKIKTKANNLMQSFDAYDKAMQSLLQGDTGAQHQFCFDSETLTDLLDAFMLNNIAVERGPYYQAKLFLPSKAH